MADTEKMSIVGGIYTKDGLQKHRVHRDGSEEIQKFDDPFEESLATGRPVVHESSRSDRHKTAPQAWQDPNTGALEKLEELTDDQHSERSMRMEAQLVKWLGTRLQDDQPIDLGDFRFARMVHDLCTAAGGRYARVAKRIILEPPRTDDVPLYDRSGEEGA